MLRLHLAVARASPRAAARYCFERTAINFEHLAPTDTVTECAPAADRGAMAFYNERVDLFLDAQWLEPPE